jgi:outer membrane protein TolC
MNRSKPTNRSPFRIRPFLIYIALFPLFASGQNTLQTFLDSALIHNPEAVSIQTQINSYQYDNQMIDAVVRSPKGFLSSEVLVAPYFNNDGKPIDTNPTDHAIGYDVGITNGGLYSFLFNLQVPMLKGKQVTHLQEQNQVEIDKLKTRLKLIENELKRSVGSQYFDVLAQQATVESNKENASILNQEFQLVKTLMNKGLYRFSDYRLLELELKSDSVNLNASETDFELAIRQLKATCGIRNQEILNLISPTMITTEPVTKPSLFIQPFSHDSLTTLAQQKVFNDRYLPQLNVYANSGLNSTSIPNIQRHFGASAGLQFTYSLFDGGQKKINEEQLSLRIDESTRQKELKLKEVKTQADAYLKNIQKLKEELLKEKQIQAEYKELFVLYQYEVQRAQISMIELITLLKKRSEINLAITLKEITINKLINEYNYWNH